MHSLKQADARVSKLRSFRFVLFSFLVLGACLTRQASAADAKQEALLKLIEGNPATVAFAAQPIAADVAQRIAYQSQLQLAPASLMKIPSSYAALRFLGRDYRYKVHVYLQREAEKNVLTLSASGTPDLVIEDLFLLARRIVASGIRFDRLKILQEPNFYFKELGPEAYQAAVTSLSVNYNTLSLQICPNKTDGPATISTELPELPQRIQGQVHSLKNPKRPLQVDVRYSSADRLWQTNVSGEVAAGTACFLVYKALPEAGLAVAPVLANILKQQGVELLSFETHVAATPAEEPLFVYELRPLTEVVWRMNRFSSNFIAQQMALAFRDSARSLAPDSGLAFLDQYLKRQFVSAAPIKMFDASGLNSENRVTADFLLDVLLDAARRPELSTEFAASLSVPRARNVAKSKLR
jgi:serine-type D-Ala-D-Ala carboxypeptidase/endopeptidase (penicillin-binding protein 4)